MKKIVYPLYLCFIFILFFACKKSEIDINETFYKIYDTELSGALKGLPTDDLGILILEAETEEKMSSVGTPISVDFPHITKFGKDGNLVWQFKSEDYFAPQHLQEEATHFSLFTYTTLTPEGVPTSNYDNRSNVAEVQIDKQTGKEIKKIIYAGDAFNYLPQKIANGKYLSFDATQVRITDANLRVTTKNDWLLPDNPSYMDNSEQHFIFKQVISSKTNLILAVNQNLTGVSTLCFSSLDPQYIEGNLITNVYPINNEEYIFVIYATSGLQTSIYFTPAISLKEELESAVLKEPIFRNSIFLWVPPVTGPPIITQEYITLKNRYENSFRTPLRAKDILERAKTAGELFRTFDLDINDNETFVKKAKDRILIVRNSASYQILIYEYLITEKRYKLLKTLGRNIPYYIQDVNLNARGDLFIVGNTQIAKEANSLFVIKIPYEDLPY
jgi:hypothetical protein